jgi:RNA-directed DNA polymerase
MLTNLQKRRPRVEVGKERLDIRSLTKLEFSLGMGRKALQAAALKADRLYAPFPKAERIRPFQKKFKLRRKRLIDNPIEPLRTIQKRIQTRLLSSVDLPFYLCGGVKGRTIVDNVTIHLGAPVIATVDIRNFFPSIHNRMVYKIWADLLGCSAEVASLLTRLTTRMHYLPQGSSTSTMLANLVLFSVGRPILEACEHAGVRYSTWVDDLAFSGANARDVLPTVIRTLTDAGFEVSRRKICIMGGGTRKILNGILLGAVPTLLPERIKQLRSGIHKLSTGEVPGVVRKRYISQLGASIAQAGCINPAKALRLQEEFDLAVRQSRQWNAASPPL